MAKNIIFQKPQFDRLFPFYILVDSDLKIESCGKTLHKLLEGLNLESFSELFRVERPDIGAQSFDTIAGLTGQMVILKCRHREKIVLRGQIDVLGDRGELLFMGSPWFGSIEEVIQHDLSLKDFAFHDPMIDLLHVLKTQEITTQELKELLVTVNQQKNDLKKAAKEIHDIALFPMQNPDPLIRIDFEGNVLKENPCADTLQEFSFEGRSYPAASFWKEISCRMDPESDRTEIEATSADSVYSFRIKASAENGYYNIYGRDITEQKKLEKDLIKAKDEAEASNRSKNNFLSNMSHEIRTPMNAIMGMTEQLEQTRLDEDQRSCLETIRSSTDHLLTIINDILDVSKIEAGELVLEHIGFEPRALIERVIQVMRHEAQQKGLHFGMPHWDTRVSQVLIGDPYRLSQILLNLISNAVKFTQDGSVEIACALLDENEKQQRLQVQVADTGIGMDEDFLEGIFQKFSQEDDSITRTYGGTGLGMSICHELVGLMNGSIDVRSKKGEGTVVSVMMDLERGSATDLLQENSEVWNTKDLRGKRILVVDDNAMNRKLATKILEKHGVVIREASNGQEAIDSIIETEFDVILMDVQMPVMDGVEAVEVIRRNISEELPVIALTAFALKGQEEKILKAGMSEYLSKPFSENQLLEVVTRWISYSPEAEQASPRSAPSEEQLFDLSKLDDIADGDAGFIVDMIHLFIEQAGQSMEQIERACATGHYEQVGRIAHRLKPAIDDLRISSLETVVREIESSAEEYRDSDKLKVLVDKLESDLTRVVLQLKQKLAA